MLGREPGGEEPADGPASEVSRSRLGRASGRWSAATVLGNAAWVKPSGLLPWPHSRRVRHLARMLYGRVVQRPVQSNSLAPGKEKAPQTRGLFRSG